MILYNIYNSIAIHIFRIKKLPNLMLESIKNKLSLFRLSLGELYERKKQSGGLFLASSCEALLRSPIVNRDKRKKAQTTGVK